MQSLASSISVLSCPACGEEYQSEGKQQPMSLRCGHTFCLGEEQIGMTLICNATMSVTCTHTEGGTIHIRDLKLDNGRSLLQSYKFPSNNTPQNS